MTEGDRTGMTLTRPDPMRDFVSLREAMDRLLEDRFIRPSGLSTGDGWRGAVPCDLYQANDEFALKASLPGISPDDLDVNATSDSVTIRGEVQVGRRGQAGAVVAAGAPPPQVPAQLRPAQADRSERGRSHVRARRVDPDPAEGGGRAAEADQGQDRPGDRGEGTLTEEVTSMRQDGLAQARRARLI